MEQVWFLFLCGWVPAALVVLWEAARCLRTDWRGEWKFLAWMLGLLAVGAVLAGAVCLKDKLDRMEETLKAVSKTLQEVKTELETVKGRRQEVAEIKLDTVAAKLDTARDID